MAYRKFQTFLVASKEFYRSKDHYIVQQELVSRDYFSSSFGSCQTSSSCLFLNFSTVIGIRYAAQCTWPHCLPNSLVVLAMTNKVNRHLIYQATNRHYQKIRPYALSQSISCPSDVYISPVSKKMHGLFINF